MTYIATISILWQAVETDNLTEWHLEEGHSQRKLFLTPEMAAALANIEDTNYNFRELRNVIRSFLAGHFVTVCLTGEEKAKADFKRLAGLNEVWALCSRKQKSEQYRILGRFADRDIFVGLALFERAVLGDKSNYHTLAEQIGSQWNSLLPGLSPVSGTSINSYFGGVYRNVDEF